MTFCRYMQYMPLVANANLRSSQVVLIWKSRTLRVEDAGIPYTVDPSRPDNLDGSSGVDCRMSWFFPTGKYQCGECFLLNCSLYQAEVAGLCACHHHRRECVLATCHETSFKGVHTCYLDHSTPILRSTRTVTSHVIVFTEFAYSKRDVRLLYRSQSYRIDGRFVHHWGTYGWTAMYLDSQQLSRVSILCSRLYVYQEHLNWILGLSTYRCIFANHMSLYHVWCLDRNAQGFSFHFTDVHLVGALVLNVLHRLP